LINNRNNNRSGSGRRDTNYYSGTYYRREDREPVDFTGNYMNNTRTWWIWVFAGIQAIQLGLRAYSEYQKSKSFTDERDFDQITNQY
jgi:hypothetical protein